VLTATSGGVQQTSCLNIPLSSAVMVPQSCWLTGPTASLIVGSVPGHSNEGEIAVVRGQAQSVVPLPSSGPLKVTQVKSGSACVVDSSQQYRAVDLATGVVAPPTNDACVLNPDNTALSAPAVTAPPNTASPDTRPSAAPLVTNSAADLPPAVTPSYYEYASYMAQCTSISLTCPFYQQGELTYTPSQNGSVVLDMGAQCYVPGTSPVVYGLQMFDEYSTCYPDTSLQPMVQNWISGYESDHGAGTVNLTLAIGTSNSLNAIDPNYSLTDGQMGIAGENWYQNVVHAVSTAGLAAPLTIWGASDMEQASDGNWYDGPATLSWMDGYEIQSSLAGGCSLQAPGYVADYGDDILGGSGSADGWTVQEVYDVAWGTPDACALPEIYFSDMATEWQALSLWGAQNGGTAISFSGVMTEVESGTLSPTEAWDALQGDTDQSPPIPSVTTIAWTLQAQSEAPLLSAVSPAQGPLAGGTQVVITGSYFLGAQAVYFGSNLATTFTVTGGQTISATAPAGSTGFVDVRVETGEGTSSVEAGDGFIYTTAGAFHPLTPNRIEDTRPGSGLPGASSEPGPNQVLNVQATGAGGIPASGVSAVVVNIAITAPTTTGFVNAFPTGVAVPNTSTMNFVAGATTSALAEVAVGDNGQISVYNAAGWTQVIVDVEGWYDTSAPNSGAGLYNPLTTPQRIVDTRPATGTPYSGQTLGAGQSLTIQVAGVAGVPSSGAEAAVANVTVVNASSSSYLSVYPSGTTRPEASVLNFVPGQVIGNQVTVELGSTGALTIWNAAGSVNVIVDLSGWYSDGASGATSGSSFNVLVPTRAVDTRPGSGQAYAGDTLPPGATLDAKLAGLAGIPAQGATAVVVNIAAADETAAGTLAAWPDGQTQLTTSELNWLTQETAANMAVVAMGNNGTVDFSNGSTGYLDLIIDASGWFKATAQGHPVVSAVSPAQGSPAGGTHVVISGSNFLGAETVYFGSTPATGVTVNSTSTISATAPAGTIGFADVRVETPEGTSSTQPGDGFLYTAAGAFHPVTPTRIEDTRPGSGADGAGDQLGPGAVLNVQVTGEGGVPTSGVSAVVVNIAITAPTAPGFVNAFPTGVAVPNTSTMNFVVGATTSALAEVAVGDNGQISIYNAAGWTQVIVDVEGWYDTTNPTAGAGLYNALPTPHRIVDTRPGTGTPYSGQTLGAGQSLTIQVAGVAGVPSSGAEAVVANVTVVNASSSSYLSIFPAGTAMSETSDLNFVPGQVIGNQVTVELGSTGAVTIWNAAGSVDVIVDLSGWYSDGASGATSGSSFNVLVPARAVDTRSGSGLAYAGETLSPGATLDAQLAGLAGIPNSGVTDVVVNIAVTDATAAGTLAAWPNGQTQPTISELNWQSQETVGNMAVVAVGTVGTVDFSNGSTGSVDLIIDASGWFGLA
jgi:hypothetical protein